MPNPPLPPDIVRLRDMLAELKGLTDAALSMIEHGNFRPHLPTDAQEQPMVLDYGPRAFILGHFTVEYHGNRDLASFDDRP